MAPDRKGPVGRTPLPVTVMNVKMCCAKCEEKAREECEEVEGVVKVVTNQSENKVVVYGAADQSALLKKMRRHLDKHAMYWPMDGNQDQIAPPLFPVDPRDLQSKNRSGNRNAGPPLQTGTVLPVDPRDGRPLVDSREVRQVEREIKIDAESREKLGGPNIVPRDISNGGQEGVPREVVFVPVDANDGTPVDPRSVRKVEPTRDGRPPPVDARDQIVRPIERMEIRGDPRDPNHAAGQTPREVVFIPVDAKDGSPVDPRRLHQVVDARDAGGRPLTPPHTRPVHGEVIREVRPLDRREGIPVELREMRPIDAREVRPLDPRDGRPIDVSELRPIDPRNNLMRPAGDPRDGLRMDSHVVMRPGEPLDRRDNMRPVDPGMGRQIDPRDMDPRDGRAYGPSNPPWGGRRVPEGLGAVRTGRAESREVQFAPRISPTRGDLGPRSPREAEYMPRSPRQHHPPDYGPRSPREAVLPEYGPRSPRDHVVAGAEYGPRSPRGSAAMDYHGPRSPRGSGEYGGASSRPPAMRPVLDRELSFTEFGTGRDPRGGMDQGHTATRVPMPYEPVDPRDAAAFDFHGGANPRSPRSAAHFGPPDEPRVRGYGDIDPRQFRRSEPRGLVDVMHEMQGAGIRDRDRDREYGDQYYRGRGSGMEGSPRGQHVSQHSEFRKGEADLREYEPKESYFSDYHPSQNYQPGPLATQELDELAVPNPNYTKHIRTGSDHF